MAEESSRVHGLSGLARKKKNKEGKGSGKVYKLKDHPTLKRIKPKRGYAFHSDYFQIDGQHATILSVFHHTGADDALGAFWGINLIPQGLDASVSVRKIEQVGRMPQSWIDMHQGRAEGLLQSRTNELGKDGSLRNQQKLNKEQEQLVEIAQDLMNGSSYLRVAIRLFVKAPTLELLDHSVRQIERQYKDRFDTVYPAPFIGEQRRELSQLYGKVEDKISRNFMFTSPEYAGSYSLVTRGIEDASGEYIGQMMGDVNSSAIVMDMDKYDERVVIAGGGKAQTMSLTNILLNKQRGIDLWGTKIGMSALMRNKRVIHLVLNRAKVDRIGVNLSDITTKVDMTRGDINPFEVFGSATQELGLFSAHLEKWALLVNQLKPMTKNQQAIVEGELKDALTDFYVDKRMWAHDAQNNRDKLRLVGIPHEEVPKLPLFLSYLEMKYNAQVQASAKDPDILKAYGFLRTAFREMLSANGDLFNTTTSTNIDKAAQGSRVIYDFSALLDRGHGLMMAQFVNALSFAVGNLRQGDVVVLHGAELLKQEIKGYVHDKFDQLQDKGVRLAYLYNDVETAMKDRDFNHFDRADYTLFGGMTKSGANLYEETLKQEVPSSLKSLLVHKNPTQWYLRRGFDNLVFHSDVQVGITFK